MQTNEVGGFLCKQLGIYVVKLYDRLAASLATIDGFPTDKKALGKDNFDYDFDYDLSREESTVLNKALAILKSYYPKMAEVRVFKALNETAMKINGYVNNDNPDSKWIALNQRQLKAGLMETLATINHERRHIDTGAEDGSRQFVYETDREVAEFMLEQFSRGRKVELTLTDRGFKLPADLKISLDSTAQVAVLDRVITVLVDDYRLEAELKTGCGRCWATERAVTIYKKGLYVNLPKEVREKLPEGITFTVK